MTKHSLDRAITFRLGGDLAVAMDRLHDRDGISPSEMIRRALTAWLPTKGVLKARKAPTTAHAAAVTLGRLGGLKGGHATSEAKSRAARENGTKGGRPTTKGAA